MALRDVAGPELRRVAGVRDLLDEGLEMIGGAGDGEDVMAVGGELPGDLAADASAGAGDDGESAIDGNAPVGR